MKVNFKEKPFYLNENDITWVDETFRSMSLEEKIGQLFCVIYYDNSDEEINKMYNEFQPGGGMYRPMPLAESMELTRKILKISKIPPLISANLEKGGNGIIEEGTLFHSPLGIGATKKPNIAKNLATICAKEAQTVGCNWSFAPIIDLDYNYRNPITNTRTFGSDVEMVAKMGAAYVEEIQKHGIAASIKHFPGDGVDERDQHLVTSINDLSVLEWDNTFGRVYQESIDKGALTVMVGHIMQPNYTKHFNPTIKDNEILPATLSRELMVNLLREKLGFNGLIVTDATTMAGFTIPMPRSQAVPKSIAAGADMFLFTRNLEEDYGYMLEGYKNGIITDERLDDAVRRILALKASLKLHTKKIELDLEKAKEIVGCKEHQDLAKEAAELSITLVKEEKEVLPLSTQKYKKILYYPIESMGGSGQYSVKGGVCDYIKEKFIKEGFEVDTFVPNTGKEGKVPKEQEIISNYDLIVYAANIATKSNQTMVRIEWAQPMGANCPHFIESIPTIFISVENPYHLLDVPRVKTFINTYNSSEHVLDSLIDKLMGRSKFIGNNPVDPFCGRWDTKL